MKLTLQTEVKLPLEITAYHSSILFEDVNFVRDYNYPTRFTIDVRGGRFGEMEREAAPREGEPLIWEACGCETCISDRTAYRQKLRYRSGE
jgi:hypothetical protein